MDHDRAFKAFRLRGVALQLERGEWDRDFAEAELSLEKRRALIVKRVRELADMIERGRGQGCADDCTHPDHGHCP